MIEAYREIFNGEDQEKKLRAAKAWSKWEASTSFINHNPEAVKHKIFNLGNFDLESGVVLPNDWFKLNLWERLNTFQ